MRYEKVWEGSDLFGFDVISLRVHIGKKHVYWKLYINREVSNNEVVKVSIAAR
jgi:hypothetical protein